MKVMYDKWDVIKKEKGKLIYRIYIVGRVELVLVVCVVNF